MVDGVLVDGVAVAGELDGAVPVDEGDDEAPGGAAKLAVAASPSVVVKIIERNLSITHPSLRITEEPQLGDLVSLEAQLAQDLVSLYETLGGGWSDL